MNVDIPFMEQPSASEFLELAAGERCPCGHTRGQHDRRPGDDMGPCHVHGCVCKGLIYCVGTKDDDD